MGQAVCSDPPESPVAVHGSTHDASGEPTNERERVCAAHKKTHTHMNPETVAALSPDRAVSYAVPYRPRPTVPQHSVGRRMHCISLLPCSLRMWLCARPPTM